MRHLGDLGRMTRSRGFHDRLPEKRRVKAAHGGLWSFEELLD